MGIGLTRAFVFQFLRFAIVGSIGFTVTTAVVYATKGFLGAAYAGLPAFFSAVTVAWLLNRSWTFRYQGSGSLMAQWCRYVLWTGPTLAINASTYETMVLTSDFARQHPVVGTTTGAIAGMIVSFTIMRRFVFKQPVASRSRPTTFR